MAEAVVGQLAVDTHPDPLVRVGGPVAGALGVGGGHDEQRTGDVRDAVPADLEGFDAVVHMAELSNDPTGELRPGITHEINQRYGKRLRRPASLIAVSHLAFGLNRATAAAACSWAEDGRDRPAMDDLLDRLERIYGKQCIREEYTRLAEKR